MEGLPKRGMSRNTINQVITRRVDKWLESIDNEELRAKCKADTIVTGGSIASMLLGEQVNDIDIYFKNYETVVKIAHYYLEKFQAGRSASPQGGVSIDMSIQEMTDTLDRKRCRIVVKSAGVAGDEQKSDYRYFENSVSDTPDAGAYIDEAYQAMQAEAQVDEEVRPQKPEFHPVFLSSNAITLKGDVQLIIRFYGGPEAIHENFDFIHCTNYWTRKEGVVLNMEALESLMARKLVYRGSLYPVCSVFRAKKFIERGWKINAGQYLKMCLQISNLDLSNFIVLEEQLTGVDVAYFSEVLDKARQKDENGNPKDVIETTYLVEIIDRMF